MLFYMRNKDSKLLLEGQMLYCNDPAQVAAASGLVFSWRKP